MQRIISKIKEIKGLFEPLEDILVFVKNTDRQYVYMNNAFLRVTSYRMSEILYETSEVFLQAPSEHLSRAIENDNLLLSGKERRTLHNMWLSDGSGRQVLMRVTKMPLTDSGVIIGLLGVAEELTGDLQDKYLMFNRIISVLSDEEYRAFRLRARGKERAEVAREMGIDVTTFDTYAARIKDKLGMDSGQIEIIKEVCADLIRHGFIVMNSGVSHDK